MTLAKRNRQVQALANDTKEDFSDSLVVIEECLLYDVATFQTLMTVAIPTSSRLLKGILSAAGALITQKIEL